MSERDIQHWHEIQTSLAPLYARLLGIPAVFVNKVGPYASRAPVRWLPASSEMTFPGHATIADPDGTVTSETSDEEGVLVGTVTLDPARKIHTKPKTCGKYVYPAGVGGWLVLAPAWVGTRMYEHSARRRKRAALVSASEHFVNVKETD